VLIGIETKDAANFKILEKKFAEAGWAYQDITDNQVLADFII
jgi:threonine dehydratase